jgi:hypothetical protein
MKNIWYVVNIALVGFALLFGYYSSSPENLRHANPDAISCGAVLLTMPVFAIFSVHYSMRRWTHGRLARPSLSRKIGNWKQDPLQRLFLAMGGAAFMAIGAALRRPTIGSVGFWMLALYVCAALGLLVGQILVYRIYRENIIAA